MLITRLACPICARRGDEGNRVVHDDVAPPDAAGVRGFRCPISYRIVIVDVRAVE